MRTKNAIRFLSAVGAFLFVGGIGTPRVVLADPVLANPGLFQIELVADFAPLGAETEVLHLTITGGENGFPPGMYVTSPFSLGTHRLFRVDGAYQITEVLDGLNNPESILFARGAYGDGMLISEASELRILRLLSDGTLATFASLGTPTFGPVGMVYGADDLLYVMDFLGGALLRVNPDGTSQLFASIPLPNTAGGPPGSFVVAGVKPVIADTSGQYGGAFICGTFSVVVSDQPDLLNEDKIYLVSTDGTSVTAFVGGFNGLEFLTLGPGDIFGTELYVAEMGSNIKNDGNVYTVSPSGTVALFLSNIDATHVVFDTENVLGGGMFVAEFGNLCPASGQRRSGRIWRVTPRAFPIPTSSEWGLIVMTLLLLTAGTVVLGRTRRPAIA